MYPLLEAISCPWVKLVYLSRDLSSLCACVCAQELQCRRACLRPCEVLRLSRIVQNAQQGKHPRRAYLSALAAHVIDQVCIATCSIPRQILLPTDLINGPQTETLILHQTPTNSPPPPPPNTQSLPLNLLSLAASSFPPHIIVFLSPDHPLLQTSRC